MNLKGHGGSSFWNAPCCLSLNLMSVKAREQQAGTPSSLLLPNCPPSLCPSTLWRPSLSGSLPLFFCDKLETTGEVKDVLRPKSRTKEEGVWNMVDWKLSSFIHYLKIFKHCCGGRVSVCMCVCVHACLLVTKLL